jgi:hypothetical protein
VKDAARGGVRLIARRGDPRPGGGTYRYLFSPTKGSYVMVQGAVRTREYERDGGKHRIVEVRADTIGKLDRAERCAEAEGESEAGDA